MEKNMGVVLGGVLGNYFEWDKMIGLGVLKGVSLCWFYYYRYFIVFLFIMGC